MLESDNKLQWPAWVEVNFLAGTVACVASVSARVRGKKLGREQKKISRNNSIGNACYAGYRYGRKFDKYGVNIITSDAFIMYTAGGWGAKDIFKLQNFF